MGYGGWSPIQSHTQSSATPDPARLLTATSVSTTSIALTWDAPAFNNGAAITHYIANCTDASDYMPTAASIWIQPPVYQSVVAPGNPLAEVGVTLTGLTPGTTYLCRISSENAVGGYDPVFDSFYSPVATFATAADAVASSNALCDYQYDPITAGSGGGGPNDAGPSPIVLVGFDAPRPNDASENLNGMPSYSVSGPLGDRNVTRSGTLVQAVAAAPHISMSDGLTPYAYNTPYTFRVIAFSDQFFAPAQWTDVTCTTPIFRPSAPVATLVQIVDRSVIVNWSAPVDNGATVNQILYEICQGSSCTLGGPGTTPWNNKRYMCADGNSRPSNRQCSYGGTADGMPGQSYPMAPASQSFTINMIGSTVDLTPQTSYKLVIRARNSCSGNLPGTSTKRCGIGWASNVLSFTTLAVPGTPTSTTITPRTIALSWPAYTAAGSQPDSYTVTCVTTAQNGTSVTYTRVAASTPSPNLQTTTFDGLVPGLSATFTVQATVSGVLTGPSDSATFTTLEDVPDAVDTPVLSSERTDSVDVSAPLPYFNGHTVDSLSVHVTSTGIYGRDVSYNLTIAAVSSTSGFSYSSGTGMYTYTVSGLTPATSYSIAMTASNQLGAGPSSPSVSVTTCSAHPFAPTVAPTFVSHTTSSITISWEQPTANAPTSPTWTNGAPITDWTVVYQQGSSTPVAVTTGSTTQSYEVQNMLPGRNYRFAVDATNGVGRAAGTLCSATGTELWGGQSPQSIVLQTLPVPPEAPLAPSCTDPQGLQLQVVWSAPFDNGSPITAYTIYTNATEDPRVITDLSTLESFFSSLTPNTIYGFQVTANNSAGESPPSPNALIRTDVYVPSQMFSTNFAEYPQRTPTSITVEWTPPDDNGLIISNYEIKYRCTSVISCPTSLCNSASCQPGGVGFVLNSAICGADNNVSACRILSYQQGSPALVPNSQYDYSVRSYNGYMRFGMDGFSPYSPWQTFATGASTALVPPAPEGWRLRLWDDETTCTTASLGWLVPTQQELRTIPAVNRYQVNYYPTDDPTSTTQQVITDGFYPNQRYNLTMTGLLAATQYTWTYLAGNSDGPGPQYNTSFTTQSCAPDAPGTPSVVATTGTTITMSFAPARPNGPAVTSYTVSIDGATDVFNTGSIANNGSLLTLTIPGSSAPFGPGQTFNIQVSATNTLGTGPPSATVQMTTAAAPQQPDAPVQSSGISGLDPYETIQVAWTAPYDYGSPITSYDLLVDSAVVSTNGTDTSYVLVDVLPSSVHTFAVRAYNAYGWSVWSTSTNITVAACFSCTPTMNGPPTYALVDGNLTHATQLRITVPAADPQGHPIAAYHIESSTGGAPMTVDPVTRSTTIPFQGCAHTGFSAMRYRARPMYYPPGAALAAISGVGWTSYSTPYTALNCGSIMGSGNVVRPYAPLDVTLVASDSNTLVASWTASTGGAAPTGFVLTIDGVGTNAGQVFTIGDASNTSYTWPDATPMTAYSARVMALAPNSEQSDYSNSSDIVTTPGLPPPSPLPPTAPPPTLAVPDAPEALNRGPGISGLANTTYVHLTWSPPTFTGQLAINRYVLNASTADPSNGATASQIIDLPLGLNVPGRWLGSPDSGYYLAKVGVVDLKPGATVTLDLVACNGFDASQPYVVPPMNATGGCGASATIALSTAVSVPGPLGSGIVAKWDDLQRTGDGSSTSSGSLLANNIVDLTIPLATYTGGLTIDHYEVQMRTYPPTAPIQPFTTSTGAYSYTQRDPIYTYFFKARAVNALGDGAWSNEVEVPGVTADAPPPATNLTIIPGTVRPRAFTISWILSAEATNLTLPITEYLLGVSCAETLPSNCPSNCQRTCPPMTITASDTTCTPFGSDGAQSCTYPVTGQGNEIAPNKIYSVSIRTVNRLQSIDSNFVSLVTGSSTPDAPVPIGVSAYNTTGFTISWTAAEPNGLPLQGNTVQLCCTTTEGDPCLDVYQAPGLSLATAATSHTFDNLPSGSNCSITLTANNSLGPGPPATFDGEYYTWHAPREGNVPARVAALPGVPATTVLHISWAPPFSYGLPIEHYHLIADGGAEQIIEDVSAPQFLLVGLIPGTTHNFSVAARNAIGRGPFSSVAEYWTHSDVPGVPIAPTASTGNGQSAASARETTLTIGPAAYAGVKPDETFVFTLPSGNTMNTTLVYELLEYESDELVWSSNYTQTPPFLVTRPRASEVNYQYRVRAYNAFGGSVLSPATQVDNVLANYSNSCDIVTTPGLPPPSPLPPTAPPPTLAVPDAPEALNRGPGISGLANTTYVHLTWSPPTFTGQLAINRYVLNASTADPSNGATASQIIDLPLGLNVPGRWLGSPDSGYYLAKVGVVDLKPGATVTLDLVACNGFDASQPYVVPPMNATGGCGASATIALSTAVSVPGPLGSGIVAKWDDLQRTGDGSSTSSGSLLANNIVDLTIPLATYTGGLTIDHYEVQMRTYPPTAPIQPFTTSTGAYSYTQRDPIYTYFFKARAVNALGDGAWSNEVEVPGVTADAPPPATNLTIIPGTVRPRAFTISWILSAEATNLTLPITEYLLGVSCAETLPSNCPSNCQRTCPPMTITASDTTCTPFGSDGAQSCTYPVTGQGNEIAPNKIYSVSIRTVNRLQSIDSNFVSLVTGSSTPDAPVPIGVSAYNTTGFTISWTAAEPNGLPLQGNTVQLCCTTTEGDPCLDVYQAPGLSLATAATSHTFDNLPSGSNCSITLTANNSLGPGPPATFDGEYYTWHAPREGNVPARVAALPGVPATTVLHISWAPPFSYGLPIEHYHLIADGGAEQIIEDVSAPQFLLVGLIPGTTHNFSVAARNAIGRGPFSSVAEYWTHSDVPGVPIAPTASTGNGQSAASARETTLTIGPAAYAGVKPDETFVFTLPSGNTMNTTLVYELLEYESDELVWSSNYTQTPPFLVTRPRASEVNYQYRVRAYNAFGGSVLSPATQVDNVLANYSNSCDIVTTPGLPPPSPPSPMYASGPSSAPPASSTHLDPPPAPPAQPLPLAPPPLTTCGTSTTLNSLTGQCEIACGQSGRRIQEEVDELAASSTRELVSAYMAAHPTFKPGELDGDLITHLEKLSKQLFGQPALA